MKTPDTEKREIRRAYRKRFRRSKYTKIVTISKPVKNTTKRIIFVAHQAVIVLYNNKHS